MPLLYSVIARGTTVLARYATCAGNFAEVTEQILTKISPGETGRLTYSHASYLFHYVAQDGVVYLCITDDEFERQRAFLFLEDIKQRFQATYGSRVHTALPYAMNSEFAQVLATQMKHYTESRDIDNISRLQGEVSDVKDILVKNIESLASRGERLELLINKTENLNTSAVTFKTTSRTLARSLWWKNVRIILFIILGIGASIYIIGAMICGLAWQNCPGQ
ncbi:vesicle-associated membrane protein 7-like [Penaeus japonicus]|uniref:vesicle-associated membrane protein 7-like n=1 Tax=Penaeus japonicus TaxID=27405 RepID=UPI001C7144E0|nr:vesicle-associated membrane protein 7-like [Penaeus japonicus]